MAFMDPGLMPTRTLGVTGTNLMHVSVKLNMLMRLLLNPVFVHYYRITNSL